MTDHNNTGGSGDAVEDTAASSRGAIVNSSAAVGEAEQQQQEEEEVAKSVRHKIDNKVPRAEWTEAEKRWAKEEKKRLKEAEKAAKQAVKESRAQDAAASAVVPVASALETLAIVNDAGEAAGEPPLFGKFSLKALSGYKQRRHPGDGGSPAARRWVEVAQLDAAFISSGLPSPDTPVWLRGRVHTVRAQGNKCAFVVLRQRFHTLQVVLSAADGTVPREMIKWVSRSADVTNESIVDVRGCLVPALVNSCSQSEVELQATHFYVVDRAQPDLPFELDDAGRAAHEDGAHVHRDTRLDHRVVDLRVPAHQAVMRVQAGVSRLFREALIAMGFTEIHTPKIIGGTSEGGTEVFRLKYFEHDACLAQSPQLYKQMAICADMQRVFEVGPVFRAENHNTYRHLAEFTGLDFEMEIRDHYHEVLDMLDRVFLHVFRGLERHYADELACIQRQYPSERLRYHPERSVRLTHAEGVRMLRAAGHEMGELDDFSSELEKALGRLVAEQYHTDFYILDRFPAEARPFYTMPAPDDSRYTNSFDVFIRGEEILSGAQRVHDAALLAERAAAKGIDVHSIRDYVEAFRYGAPPHGGVGVGLERVVMLFLGMGNVRECCMFPRERRRLYP